MMIRNSTNSMLIFINDFVCFSSLFLYCIVCKDLFGEYFNMESILKVHKDQDKIFSAIIKFVKAWNRLGNLSYLS